LQNAVARAGEISHAANATSIQLHLAVTNEIGEPSVPPAQRRAGKTEKGALVGALLNRIGNRCRLANDLCNSRISGGQPMAARQSKAQKETVSRVMHEFKHGELETSSGRKVRNPKQAIAIGLREAAASKYESKEKNRKNLKRTKARERHGATAKERSRRHDDGQMTRAELYAEAKRRNIPGRSKMSKRELERALH
jgi:Family of unknown function (DUF6496)